MSYGRRASPMAWASLLLCAAAFFAPFLLRGDHLVSFNLERAGSTAIPGGGLVPRTAGRFPRDNSPTVLHYPNAALASECLRSGRLPLWNPYQACGAPALGGGQVYPFSPFLWPFYVHPTPRAFTLGLLIGSIFTGLGAMLWMGRFLKGWPLGLGAALWAFNPWTLRCIGFNNSWADWWLPWTLWAWHLALERRRGALVLPALFVTGAVYCGHPESALVVALCSALYAVGLWAVEPKGERVSIVRLGGLMTANGLLAVALCAVHWLPLLGVLRESVTYKSSGAVGRLLYPAGSLFNPGSELYTNPLLFLLAVVGCVALGRRREHRSVLLLPALGLLLSLQLPFLSLLQGPLSLGGRLPGLYARSVFWAGLAACVAAGVSALVEETGKTRALLLRLLALGALAYAVLAWADYESGSIAWLMNRPGLLACPGAALLCLLGAAFAPHLELKRGLLAMAFALVLADPLVVQRFRYPAFNDLEPLAGGPPALAELGARTSENHGRFWAGPGANRERPDLEPNLATLWRARDVRMVSPIFLGRYLKATSALAGAAESTPGTWLLLEDVPAERLGLLSVAERAQVVDERMAVFDWTPLSGALPRARLVHQVLPARDGAEALAWLREGAKVFPDGSLQGSVILEGWHGVTQTGDAGEAGSVSWVLDEPGEVRLKVASGSGGVLVLLDTFAEGWWATVDGARATLYPANVAFMGVGVPAGEHEVAFRYEPRSVRLGLWMSLAGWGVVGILGVWSLRRRPEEVEP
jgi:hypothetical protein